MITEAVRARLREAAPDVPAAGRAAGAAWLDADWHHLVASHAAAEALARWQAGTPELAGFEDLEQVEHPDWLVHGHLDYSTAGRANRVHG